MAIERPGEPAVMESSMMADDADEAPRAFIPSEVARGAKAGDVIRLKVVSVDEEDGSVEVEYATDEAASRGMGPDMSDMDGYFARRGGGSPPTD